MRVFTFTIPTTITCGVSIVTIAEVLLLTIACIISTTQLLLILIYYYHHDSITVVGSHVLMMPPSLLLHLVLFSDGGVFMLLIEVSLSVLQLGTHLHSHSPALVNTLLHYQLLLRFRCRHCGYGGFLLLLIMSSRLGVINLQWVLLIIDGYLR